MLCWVGVVVVCCDGNVMIYLIVVFDIVELLVVVCKVLVRVFSDWVVVLEDFCVGGLVM